MLPLYKQEQPASCVAACVRMVLAAFGYELPEQEVRRRCGQTALGLRLDDVSRGISDLPFMTIVHSNWGVDDLRDALRKSGYPIVGINLRAVDGRFAYHAIVLTGIDRKRVTVHDPEPGEGIREMNLQTFLNAWESADRQALMILPIDDSTRK